MKNRIYIAIGIATLSFGLYYLLVTMQKEKLLKVNTSFLNNIAEEIRNAGSLDDSIQILDKWHSLAKIPPYNEQLSAETMEVFDQIESLKSIQKDEKDWRKAQSENFIESYEEYIGDNPKGKYVEKAKRKINILKEEIQKENLTVFTSAEGLLDEDIADRPRPGSKQMNVRGYQLQLIKLICNKQQEIWGSDRIQIKCDGKIIIDNEYMQTGDIVDLSDTDPFQLNNGNVTVTVLERDDGRSNVNQNDLMLQTTFSQRHAERGRFEKSGSRFGGRYTLEYEIK